MSNPVTFVKGIGQDKVTGVWWMRTRINGREVRKSFPTRSLAENALKALKTKKKASELGLTTFEPTETLQSLTTRYIAEAKVRGLSPVTLLDYKKVSGRLVSHFGKRHHPRFTQDEIMDYVKARKEAGAGSPLITRELKLLQTFLKGTVGQAFLLWNVPKLHESDENAVKPIPSDKEIVAVFRKLDKRSDVQRAFLVALLLALRPSDVFNLQSSDIVDGVILVGLQKRRGKPHALPLVETLKEALQGVEGKLTPSASAVKMVLQREETGWNGFQVLRRVAATWASEAGYPDEEVGLLLGHVNWTVAGKHYIRKSSRLALVDPTIPLKREILEAVEARFIGSLFAPTQES